MQNESGRFAEFFSQSSRVGLNDCPFITGRELGDIIAPLTLETFFSDFFLRQSVFIPGERRKKLAYVTLERLRFLLSLPVHPQASDYFLAAHFRQSSVDATFRITSPEIGHLLDAGATICATNLHLIDPDLYRLTRALKLQSAVPSEVGVNCYISPDGAGFRKHFDSKTAMVVQLAGSKTWNYARTPVVEFPQRAGREQNGRIQFEQGDSVQTQGLKQPSPVRPQQIEECLLEPGDVLCLPPGTWHSACAKGFSLALTITFYPLNLTKMVFPILDAELREHTGWRSGPPPVPGGPPDSPPEPVRAYFRKRLAELRATVDAMDESDPRLWTAWYSAITQTAQNRPSVDGPGPGPNRYVAIDRTLPSCCYVLSSDGEDKIVVQHGTQRVTIYATNVYPLVRAFADGRVFERGTVDPDLVDDCTVEAVDELWDTLLAAGIARYVEKPVA